MSEENTGISQEEFEKKIQEVQQNTRATLEKEFNSRLEQELTKVKGQGEAQSAAILDQLAERLGYEGKFEGIDSVAEFVSSKNGSEDVEKDPRYLTLKQKLAENADRASKIQSEYEQFKTEVQKREERMRVEQTLSKEFSKIASNYNIPTEDAMALYMSKRQVKLEGDGIEPRTADGSPIFNQDGRSRSLSEDLKEVFKPYMKVSSGTGGGASTSGGFPAKRSDFTTDQKRQFIEKNGYEAYIKLPRN